MGNQLLFEIGAEELPAGELVPAIQHLKTSLVKKLEELRLSHGEVFTGGTPRRIVIAVDGLAAKQDDLEFVKTGPPASRAKDADGNYTKAASGFARSAGVSVDELFEKETPKGSYLAATVKQPGLQTTDLLKEALPELIKAIPFRKSMRWGSRKESFVRPIRWMVALFGGEVINFSFAGVDAGNKTYGHRIMAPGAVEVSDLKSYLGALKDAHVVVDIKARQDSIRDRLVELAKEVDGTVVADEGLIAEVANLAEAPWGAVGRFSESYLELPREVLVSSMRKHQRYFAFEDKDGNLMNAFGVFNNTKVRSDEVVLAGHGRVLRARLDDGAFFWREDRKKTLESRLDALERVTFLGELNKTNTGADLGARVKRIETLAGVVAKLAFGETPQVAADAARGAKLCKADLTTLMVGEFPDLQGVIGAYYARLDGEPESVATAIKEHYQPKGVSDAPPSSPAGICVGLADKLDLLASCFAVGLIPSGNKDPYGLRRAALGILRTLEGAQLDLDLHQLLSEAATLVTDAPAPVAQAMFDFVGGRLRSDLSVRTDIVDAVLEAGYTYPLRARKRAEALASIAAEADLAPLGEAFKRIRNILDKNADAIDSERLFNPEDAAQDEEKALGALAADIEKQLPSLVEEKNYIAAFSTLTKLAQPLDDFFTEVMVMHEDQTLRLNRLALLAGLRRSFASLADISRIHVEKG